MVGISSSISENDFGIVQIDDDVAADAMVIGPKTQILPYDMRHLCSVDGYIKPIAARDT